MSSLDRKFGFSYYLLGELLLLKTIDRYFTIHYIFDQTKCQSFNVKVHG